MYRLLPTATTADEKARGAKCAILPVGSFEQHGDYLPLITDTVVATVHSAGTLRAPTRCCSSRRSPSPARTSTAHGREQSASPQPPSTP